MIIMQQHSKQEYWYETRLVDAVKNKSVCLQKAWVGLDEKPDLEKVLSIITKHAEASTSHGPCYKVKVLSTLVNNAAKSLCLKFGEETIIHLEWDGKRVFDAFLGGEKIKELKEIVDKINKYMETLRHKSSSLVPITFSFLTPHGPRFFLRRLDCPTWEEVKQNYIGSENIDWLLNLKNPLEHGKLVFWHGIPGTGKTYCIRALMQEWKNKANFIYVLDPENLFGEAGYLIETLLHVPESVESVKSDASENGNAKDRLKVFIIEDALDFLLAENRKNISSAMSRLLNLTEGIVGQGFKVLVLITSNEEVRHVDPAFMRAGRCLQTFEFLPFESKEANLWLSKRDFFPSEGIYSPGPLTLAELYSQLKPARFGSRDANKERAAGFKLNSK